MPPRRRSIVREESFAHVVDNDGYYLQRMREILDTLPRLKPPEHHVRLCDHIFMGSQRNAEDVETLRKDGIAYVLSCVQARRSTDSPYDRASGVRGFLLIPAEDREDFDIGRFFESAIQFLQCVREEPGGQALVHCNLGVNRSGAVAAAYLMVAQRRNLLDVVKDLKLKRQSVLTNKGFRRQLIQFARGKGLLDPVVDTVTRITYCDPSEGTVAVRKRRTNITDEVQESDAPRRPDSDSETLEDEGDAKKQESFTLPRRKTRESRRSRSDTVFSDDRSYAESENHNNSDANKVDWTLENKLTSSLDAANDSEPLERHGLGKSHETYPISQIHENNDEEKRPNAQADQKKFIRYENIKLGIDLPKAVDAEKDKTSDDKRRTVSVLQTINLATSDPKRTRNPNFESSNKNRSALETYITGASRLKPVSDSSCAVDSTATSLKMSKTGASSANPTEKDIISAATLQTCASVKPEVSDRMKQSKKTVNFKDEQSTSKSVVNNTTANTVPVTSVYNNGVSSDNSSSKPKSLSQQSGYSSQQTTSILRQHTSSSQTSTGSSQPSVSSSQHSANTSQQLTKLVNSRREINSAASTPQHSILFSKEKATDTTKPSGVATLFSPNKLKGSQNLSSDIRPSTAPAAGKTQKATGEHVRSVVKPIVQDNVCTVLRTIKATCIPVEPSEIKLVVKTKENSTKNIRSKIGSDNEAIKVSQRGGLRSTEMSLKKNTEVINTANKNTGLAVSGARVVEFKNPPEFNEAVGRKLKNGDNTAQKNNSEEGIKLTIFSPEASSRFPESPKRNVTIDDTRAFVTPSGVNTAATASNVKYRSGFSNEKRRITRPRETVSVSDVEDDEDVLEAVGNRGAAALLGEGRNNGTGSAWKSFDHKQDKHFLNDNNKNLQEADDDDKNSVISCFEPYGNFSMRKVQPGRAYNSGRNSAISWYDAQIRQSFADRAVPNYDNCAQTEERNKNNDWLYQQNTSRLTNNTQHLRNVANEKFDDENFTVGSLTLYPTRAQDISRRLSSAECFRSADAGNFTEHNFHRNSNRRLSSIDTNEPGSRGTNTSRAVELQDAWLKSNENNRYDDVRSQQLGESGSGDKGRFSKLISDIKFSAVNLAIRGSAAMNLALFSAMGTSSINPSPADGSIMNSAMKFAALNTAVRSAVNTAIKGSTLIANRSSLRNLTEAHSTENSITKSPNANQTGNSLLYSNRGLTMPTKSSPQYNKITNSTKDGHSPVVVNIPVEHEDSKTRMESQHQAKQPEILDKAVLGDIKDQLRKVPRPSKVLPSKVPTSSFQFPTLRSVSESKRRTDEQKSVKQLQHSESFPETSEVRPTFERSDSLEGKRVDAMRQNQNQSTTRSSLSGNTKAIENQLGLGLSNEAKGKEFISLYVRNEKQSTKFDETFNQDNSAAPLSGSRNAVSGVISLKTSRDSQRFESKEATPNIIVTEYSPQNMQPIQDNGFATIPRTSRRNDPSTLMSKKILQQLNTAVQRHNSIQASAAESHIPLQGNSRFSDINKPSCQPDTERLVVRASGKTSDVSSIFQNTDGSSGDTTDVFQEFKQRNDLSSNDYRTWPLPSTNASFLAVSNSQNSIAKQQMELTVDCDDGTRNVSSYPSSPNVTRTKPPFQRRTDHTPPTTPNAKPTWSEKRDDVIGISQIDIRPTSNVSFRYRSPEHQQHPLHSPTEDTSQYSGFLMHVGTRRAAPLISKSSSYRNLAQQWQFESLPENLTTEPDEEAEAPQVEEVVPHDRPIRAYTRSRTDSEIVRHRPRM